MKALLGLCVLVCLVGFITNDCVSICEEKCTSFAGACSTSTLVALAGLSCDSFGQVCNRTCEDVYCPCIDKDGLSCIAAQNKCREAGLVGVLCDLEFNICFSALPPMCLLQVGAYGISSVADIISGAVAGLPALAANSTIFQSVSDLFKGPSIFDLFKLPSLSDILKIFNLPSIGTA